jgi:hypothetical protein
MQRAIAADLMLALQNAAFVGFTGVCSSDACCPHAARLPFASAQNGRRGELRERQAPTASDALLKAWWLLSCDAGDSPRRRVSLGNCNWMAVPSLQKLHRLLRGNLISTLRER